MLRVRVTRNLDGDDVFNALAKKRMALWGMDDRTASSIFSLWL